MVDGKVTRTLAVELEKKMTSEKVLGLTLL